MKMHKLDLSVLYLIPRQADRMTKFKSGDTAKLHYALTDSECNACGSHLEWQADFKDIARPRYVSYHCDYQYTIYVDNVKIDVKVAERKRKPSDPMPKGEPRAILMAQTKKKRREQHPKTS